MFKIAIFCAVILLVQVNGKPFNELMEDSSKDTIENNAVAIYNPFSPDFKWTNFNIATFTTAGIIVTAGIALLTTLFFPMFVYRICYTLGGCQDVMGKFVNEFIGPNEDSKSIKKRDVSNNQLDYYANMLKTALSVYEINKNFQKPQEDKTNTDVSKVSETHRVEKRSPVDYIEPILGMMSKAYNEFADSELKKNSKKTPPSTN